MNTLKNSWRTILGLATILGTNSLLAAAESDFELRSPDEQLMLRISARKPLEYKVSIGDRNLLGSSRLGLTFADGAKLGAEVEVVCAEHTINDTTWENAFGKRRQVRDHYRQLRLWLREKSAPQSEFQVIFRAYDDGVAFRYVFPERPEGVTVIVDKEETEFTFTGDYRCFVGEDKRKGFASPQEFEYVPSRLSTITPSSIVGVPLLVEMQGAWVAIAESDLRDWAGMWLSGADAPQEGIRGGVTLTTKLSPRIDGKGAVVVASRHNSPWRVVLIGRNVGRLIESDLIANLATPSQLPDFTWVKPGMMAWDNWWSGGVHMTTTRIKDYIQLAADMGWRYQLIDWQWYLPVGKPESDITKVDPAVDLDEVRRFAREKGVGLWLWLYWEDVERNDAYKEAFALYEKWGIAGVKIDFMNRNDQQMVNWYEKIARAAAEHHLMVNFHGAFQPAGFNRTYPNQITREGIFGNEQNRSGNRVTPEHKLMLPFTRFLAGPGDFTPGGFLNRQPNQFSINTNRSEVQGTRAAELALFVIYDSPLCCVCDAPEHYRDQPGTDFLQVVPTVWNETKVLDCFPGEYLVMARQSGGDWFLGALTDRRPLIVEVKLDFLAASSDWEMNLWRDAADSDVDAEHLIFEKHLVKSGATISIRLAPSGGAVARFRQVGIAKK